MQWRHETADFFFVNFMNILLINVSNSNKSLVIDNFSGVCLLLMTCPSETIIIKTLCFTSKKWYNGVKKVLAKLYCHKFGPVERPTFIAKAQLQWKMLDIHLSQHIRI